jgi:aminoglycoside phosphotransferase (APT) family kinase protein
VPSGPIVHGHYRLDNALLDPTTPGNIAAVLD